MKTKRLSLAILMLIISATLLSTASFAWFSMNTNVDVTGIEIEAYSDSVFIEISQERDGGYAYSAAVSPSDKAVRPVTGVRLEDGALSINPIKVADATRYSASNAEISGKSYYLKEPSQSTSDSFEGENYICVDGRLEDASSVKGYYKEGNIIFELVVSADKYNGGGTYYKKTGNSYIEQTALINGESEIRGLYTITLGASEGEEAVFDGVSRYFEKRDGGIYPVGGLELGTPLDSFYTIEEPERVSVADGSTKYYILNSRGDYVCIGTPEKDKSLTDMIYWARAYSTSVEESQGDNTLSVIKDDKLQDYYYYNKFYIRTADNTGPAERLRVDGASIAGEDSLSDAIRVLFVAKNGAGEIAYAEYNNRTKTVSHLNGKEYLFSSLLEDGSEIVEVETYIYFDGTDPSVKTKDSVLSGQKITLKFAVDEHEYAV